MSFFDSIVSVIGIFALLIALSILGIFVLALIFGLPALLRGLLEIILVVIFIIAAPILFAFWIAWDFISSLGGKSK